MHIGLLGGSFDPIHNAHIAVALSALQIRKLDQIQLIPAGQPWQKPALHASPKQRADMIALAIDGIAGMSINTMELERSGATYTIDTLESLDPSHTYYWILGSDQLANFCSWHRWQDVARKVTLLVADRPHANQQIPVALQQQIDQGLAKVEFLTFEPMHVSASELRRRITQQQAVDDMIAPAVQQYIQQHHLYQNSVQESSFFMDITTLQRAVVDALEDVKAQNIKVFNTSKQTSLFDRVVIASGTSNRQTRGLASSVQDRALELGVRIIAREGDDTGEWVLVDLGDIVVHIMQPAIREYYNLEEIWGANPIELTSDKPLSAPRATKVAEADETVVKKVAKKAVKKAAKKVAKKAVKKVAKKAAKKTVAKKAVKKAAASPE